LYFLALDVKKQKFTSQLHDTLAEKLRDLNVKKQELEIRQVRNDLLRNLNFKNFSELSEIKSSKIAGDNAQDLVNRLSKLRDKIYERRILQYLTPLALKKIQRAQGINPQFVEKSNQNMTHQHRVLKRRSQDAHDEILHIKSLVNISYLHLGS